MRNPISLKRGQANSPQFVVGDSVKFRECWYDEETYRNQLTDHDLIRALRGRIMVVTEVIDTYMVITDLHSTPLHKNWFRKVKL